MKSIRSSSVKIFSTTFLIFVLMLPYLGSFLHLFQGHDHKTCEISETHLHQIDVDCEILDYHFPTVIEISNEILTSLDLSPQQKKTSFFYLGYSFSIDTIDLLRGPPSV